MITYLINGLMIHMTDEVKNNSKAMLTRRDHSTGTDRVFEAIEKFKDKEVDIVINLQGDMPNLDPENIKNLDYLMRKNKSEIGTLASEIKNKEELKNINIVKVETDEYLNSSNFIKTKDFFRITEHTKKKNIYNNIAIYDFKKKAI